VRQALAGEVWEEEESLQPAGRLLRRGDQEFVRIDFLLLRWRDLVLPSWLRSHWNEPPALSMQPKTTTCPGTAWHIV
jgi:hypothetical protein